MNGLKKWIQNKEPKTLAFGFLLLICAAIAVNGLITRGFTSYYMTGAILLTFFGITMIRKSRR
jgi:hypothetical protein